MDKKSVKVNCSFCGKEIECPEDMLEDADKHACMDCFDKGEELFKGMSEEEIGKIHVDLPLQQLNFKMAERLADQLVKEEFTEVWSELKDDFKESSKKELAEEMFWQGANMAAATMMESLRMKAKEEEESEDNDDEEDGGEEDDADDNDEDMPISG